MARLVLGSASPRRRELLASVGIQFAVRSVDVDESVAAGETTERYLERIASAKLAAVRRERASAHPAAVVLVADTVVVVGDDILGKPLARQENARMLRALMGRTHRVMTRYVIAGPSADGGGEPIEVARNVETRVSMRAAGDDLVEQYADSGEGWDKAGGYAVQGAASLFVSRIEGSYSNVVGLPLCEVVQDLAGFGVAVALPAAPSGPGRVI